MNNSKIVLVAYQCGPEMGSVSQIGWEWYSRLCQQYQVTLVTHIRNRQALEGAQAPLADSEVIYIDTEWFAGPLYRLAQRVFPRSEHSVFLLSSLDYFLFDAQAYRTLKKRLQGGESWQLLHRVTPVTLAAPTLLGRLGLPTLVGPLNSGLNDPKGFALHTRKESTWLSKFRGLSQLLDALMGSTRHIQRILTANTTTRSAVASRYRHRCHMMLENGISLQQCDIRPWPALPNGNAPLRILFVGRLIAIKGVDMLLQAVANLHRQGHPVMLDIVGDGPMRKEWQDLTSQLELDGEVLFHGAQPHSAISGFMQGCHVFCLPSIRESGGAVLLEAMACARPVIALGFGGPRDLVSDEVGALLTMHSPEQVIKDLTATLQEIFREPVRWQHKGYQGLQLVTERYSWQAKLQTANTIYRELIQQGEVSPC